MVILLRLTCSSTKRCDIRSNGEDSLRISSWLPATPRLMKLFWSHLTVDEAREMGIQNGTSAVVEFILYYFRKFDIESLLRTFRLIGAEYSNNSSTPSRAMNATAR